MKVNATHTKRGFNRLAVVLTGLWILYALLIYPLQQQHRAERMYRSELRNCYDHELGKGQDVSECIQYADLKSGVGMWSLRAYYARESGFLALVIVAVPLIVYGLCRVAAALGVWVWRGFFGVGQTEDLHGG